LLVGIDPLECAAPVPDVVEHASGASAIRPDTSIAPIVSIVALLPVVISISRVPGPVMGMRNMATPTSTLPVLLLDTSRITVPNEAVPAIWVMSPAANA
jgi:hypothetical protein